jgi:glutathione peroxidase
MTGIYDFTVTDIHGREHPVRELAGKVLLIVNVASLCRYTPQYTGLETLWRKYRGRGLVVLGFPCNQFGGQEPEDEPEIESFCSDQFDVTFPLFAKIKVNGPGAHPLYRWLKRECPGALRTRAIKWNFTKFLVDREGRVIRRYASMVTVKRIEKDLLRWLDED